MEKQSTFFSIIIPTKNRKALLKECIDSIINQTFTDFEIIIIDDSSFDGTPEMINSLKDDRIKVVKNKGVERSAARNTGLDKAKGKFICFIDDDDWVDNDYLLTFNEAILKNKESINIFRIGYKTHKVKKELIHSVLYDKKKHKSCLRFVLENMCGVWSFCFPNKVIQTYRFNEKFPHWQDTYLLGEILLTHNFIQIQKYTYNYRIHDKMGSKVAVKPDIIKERAYLNILAIKDFYSKYDNEIPLEIKKNVKNKTLAIKSLEYAINSINNGNYEFGFLLFKESFKYYFGPKLIKYYLILIRQSILRINIK